MRGAPPSIPPLVARAFCANDVAAVQALADADPVYFEMATGAPAGPDEARNLMTELPPAPGWTLEDKYLFALVEGDQVVGVLDIIRNYPVAGTWFIGLLYLAPPQRGRGYGRVVLRGVYAWIRRNGGTKVRLGVVEENVRARRLYESEGFALEGVREPDPAVKRVRRTLVLERGL
jgi:GNAT superfamily N-acetyltransferase